MYQITACAKGQLISKGHFAIFVCTKNEQKCFSISALRILMGLWVRAPLKELYFFFLKSDLKWAFPDIAIQFQWLNLIFLELFLYSDIVRLYLFCEILIKVSLMLITLSIWIKYINRHIKRLKRTNWREQIFPSVGSNPRIYLGAEIQKYYCLFLVQMKTAKSPFEINWPLSRTLHYVKNALWWEIFYIHWVKYEYWWYFFFKINRCANTSTVFP